MAKDLVRGGKYKVRNVKGAWGESGGMEFDLVKGEEKGQRSPWHDFGKIRCRLLPKKVMTAQIL